MLLSNLLAQTWVDIAFTSPLELRPNIHQYKREADYKKVFADSEDVRLGQLVDFFASIYEHRGCRESVGKSDAVLFGSRKGEVLAQ